MTDFVVARYRIRVSDRGYQLQRPFSAVLLSDLHNVSYGKKNKILLQSIRNENPEVIFIAGDLVTAGKKPETDEALELVETLTSIYPVFYANGNHEHRLKVRTEKYEESYLRYAEKIKSYGVHLLENNGIRQKIAGLPVKIWGLELDGTYFSKRKRKELEVSEIQKLLGNPASDAYNILLAHHPLFGDIYAEWGADLTMSGHLHGGIVRLPILGGVISPQFRLFPRYDRGMYDINGKKLIVSGGLGSHTIPIRVNNPPQLVVIDFS